MARLAPILPQVHVKSAKGPPIAGFCREPDQSCTYYLSAEVSLYPVNLLLVMLYKMHLSPPVNFNFGHCVFLLKTARILLLTEPMGLLKPYRMWDINRPSHLSHHSYPTS